jgi:hypothetical protein
VHYAFSALAQNTTSKETGESICSVYVGLNTSRFLNTAHAQANDKLVESRRICIATGLLSID